MEGIAEASEEAGSNVGRMQILRERPSNATAVTVRCVVCTTAGDEMALLCSAVAKMDTPDILLCFVPHALWPACQEYV